MFADVTVSDSEEVLQNWERQKAAEKKDRPLSGSVPRSMPSLMRATRISEKVKRVGFDWPDTRGSRAKVSEEIAELDEAIASGDQANIEDELGDVLFAMRQPLAASSGSTPKGALQKTIEKFQRRFAHVELRVKELHGGWPSAATAGKKSEQLPLEELDRYWDEAKQREKNG